MRYNMKTALVVIGEFPSMRGRYHISLTVNGKTIFAKHDAGNNTGAAAASAVSCAIGYDKYTIIGCNEVINLIPVEHRTR